jgi:hypothetical protein
LSGRANNCPASRNIFAPRASANQSFLLLERAYLSFLGDVGNGGFQMLKIMLQSKSPGALRVQISRLQILPTPA